MYKHGKLMQAIATFMIFAFLTQFYGCYAAKHIDKRELVYQNKPLFRVHGQTTSLDVYNPIISNGVITGSLNPNPLVKPTKSKVVHIYVAPDSAIKISGSSVAIRYENIAKVEAPKVDVASTVIGSYVVAIGATAIFLLILILTKGASCPFIYENTGEDYAFSGEIYSGATAEPLERDDYMALNKVKPVDGQYSIRITNEVKEIQKTNLAELVIIDHEPGKTVAIDKNGEAFTLGQPASLIAATDAYGRSVTRELASRDTLRFISEAFDDNLLKDTLTLCFPLQKGQTEALLAVKAKNTMWLDYMFGRFIDLFGNRYDKWKEKRNLKPTDELRQWMQDQGMLMEVFIETDNGDRRIDCLNLPGPMADKTDVMSVSLEGCNDDIVKIKLVTGVLFWDIDYTGLYYDAAPATNKKIVSLSKATDQDGNDVSPLLLHNDDLYLVQPLVDNITEISFPVPAIDPNMSRSVFLHSRGNYEIIREPSGKADVDYLKSFLEPGAFTRFSKEHFLKYYSGRGSN
ncbi:MAG: hypothetical protein U0X39_11265 [Bacteroidales bacterium]